jgi:hypothetical protein
MRLTPRNEDDAQRLAKRALVAAGWHDARITEAVEKRSKRNNEMLEATVIVPAADGSERTLRDWFTDSPLGALKLRHAAEAVGALAKYEQQGEIGPADLAGHDVRVKISVEKRRGYPDANRIDDYAVATAGRVVNLRDAG